MLENEDDGYCDCDECEDRYNYEEEDTDEEDYNDLVGDNLR